MLPAAASSHERLQIFLRGKLGNERFRGGVAPLREQFRCGVCRLDLPPFRQQLGQPNRSGAVVVIPKFPKARKCPLCSVIKPNPLAVDLRACATPMLKHRDRSGCVIYSN